MKKTLMKITLKSETIRNLDASGLQGAAAGMSATMRTACTTVNGGCTATNVCSHCRPCF